jgi:hypothetical protein
MPTAASNSAAADRPAPKVSVASTSSATSSMPLAATTVRSDASAPDAGLLTH